MTIDAAASAARNLWQGARVRLRAFEAEDWETYHAWNVDDEQARNLDQIHFPQSAAAARQWAEREATREPEGDNFRFVIENEHGEVVGRMTGACAHLIVGEGDIHAPVQIVLNAPVCADCP